MNCLKRFRPRNAKQNEDEFWEIFFAKRALIYPGN